MMFLKNNIIYPITCNNNLVFYSSYEINRNSDILMILKPSNAEIFLLSSILLETISTACLKKTLINKLWFIPVYTGYGLSFYMFPKSLTQFSLSSAYSI